MIDPHAYNITVRRSNFEGEVCFEARVKEFPDLAEYGDNFEEAYGLAIDAIETIGVVFIEKGKAVPVPQDIPDDFSGRVTLRLPKSLHRNIAIAAEEEGVSLNQHMVNVLSYYSGYVAGHSNTDEVSWRAIPDTAKGRIESRQTLVLACSNGQMNSNWN